MSFMEKAKDLLSNKAALGIAIGSLALLTAARLYFRGGVCRVDRDLSNQVIVITGGSSGIGRQTVKELSKKGCTIIFGARDQQKSQELVRQIQAKNKGCRILYFPVDLGDKQSIEEFSQMVKGVCDHIDILINNAGLTLPTRKQTKDGFQMNMGVNHLGHFYLTYLLWQRIKVVEKPRIINVSSLLAHAKNKKKGTHFEIDFNDFHYKEGTFNSQEAYARSKLANVLFARQLQFKMNQANINGYSVSLHPGVIMTDLARDFGLKVTILKILFWPIIAVCFKSIQEGAQTTLYLVLEDESKLQKGEYYADCKVSKGSPFSQDMTNAQLLWQRSQQELGIKFDI